MKRSNKPPLTEMLNEEFYGVASFAIHYLADVVKGVLVAGGLYLFSFIFRLGGSFGLEEAKVKLLEDLHFWGSYATYLILLLTFLRRLIRTFLREKV